MPIDVNPASLWEHLADAIPDEPLLICGPVRRTWGEFDDRTARLAGALAAAGIGAGSRIGELLHNTPEYIETYAAALKLRAVPFNINYRYTADEVAYLLDNAEADVLVYDGSFAEVVARAVIRLARPPLLVHVGDGEPVAGAVAYEEALAAATPAPRRRRSSDDVAMTYTGGTTGMPKGVVAKVGPMASFLLDTVPGLLGEPAVTSYDEVADFARRMAERGTRHIVLPASPLMHNTGLTLGTMPALLVGGAVVLLGRASFDAHEVWDAIEREGVQAVTIVGDAFARPLVRALEERPGRDLSTLRFMNSSGAMFSTEVKAAILEHVPQLIIIDAIAASEGVMGMSLATAGNPGTTGSFFPLPGVLVLGEDGNPLVAGSGEAGLVAVPGGGERYLDDGAKSASTFRVIDGKPYTVPGDWAVIEPDGTLTLLGRGSSCINTAGEKVFPEEVEEVLKAHPAVEDALVFGVADERFGQRVAAVLSYSAGADEPADLIVAAAREHLAGYKVPRSVHVVDQVPRTDVGKPDYDTARQLFADAAGRARG